MRAVGSLLLLAVAALGRQARGQRLHASDLLVDERELLVDERELLVDERELVVDERRVEEDDQDDQVLELPGLDPTAKVEHHAGRIALDDGGKNQLFYWHFPAAKDPDTAPLIIWLNGGPGCSSMQGLFLGISPFKLVDDNSVGANEFGWHHSANLLFLDQPVGTGMSYTRGNDFRTDEETVASDFYQFLQKFLQKHSEYIEGKGANKRSRRLFIFGESHAGRYIPNFSTYILDQNSQDTVGAGSSGDIHIQLEGVAIGNGWVHPRIQYDYSDFAHGLGLLTFGQVRSLKTSFADCTSNLDAGNFYSTTCLSNLDAIMGSIKTGKGGKTLNYYDVRQYVHNIGSYPAGQSDIVSYLNQAGVRQALHANTARGFRFDICSNEVYRALAKFDGVSTLEKVQQLLRSGLRVLFYNGQWDMMCNHFNTEKLLLRLDWNGSDAYQSADKYTWTVEGLKTPAGFAQQGGNLTYLVVTGAGHMVPMDAPEAAADMAKRFIEGLEFNDKEQSVENYKTNATELEAAHCLAKDSSSTTANPLDINSAVSSTSLSTTEAASPDVAVSVVWAGVVIAAVSAILGVTVTVFCMRGRHNRAAGRHAMVTQESDEEGPMPSPLGEIDEFSVTKQQPEDEVDEDEERQRLSEIDLEAAASPVGTEIDL